jgi:hypothetical protein
VSFLDDSGGVGREKIQFDKRVSNFLRIFIFILRVLFLMVFAEAPTHPEGVVEVVFELSAVDKHGKGDVFFFIECILDDPLQNSECFVLAVLQHEDGDVAIFIEDEVELELGTSGVELVKWDKGRSCWRCGGQKA